MEIKKIRKMGTIKMVTIPAGSNLRVGDYVKITKINETDSAEFRPQTESAIPLRTND